jgi:hypothetical protein
MVVALAPGDIALMKVLPTAESSAGGELGGLGLAFTAQLPAQVGHARLVPAQQLVSVTGYPDSGDAPVTCQNTTRLFSRSQLEFDCDGYSGGTSGSPLVAAVDPATGLGTVIGVIGGYQQGGNTDAVSYAARIGPGVTALYRTASWARALRNDALAAQRNLSALPANILAVISLAPDLGLADALATAVAVTGEPGLALIEKLDGYEALIINSDGSRRQTESFPIAP